MCIRTYSLCNFWNSPVKDGILPEINAFLRFLWKKEKKNKGSEEVNEWI